MAATASTMLPLGTKAPEFDLPDTESGDIVSLSDFKDATALLVVFMCNHCPFVMHILDKFVELADGYQAKGVAVVGISSNDISSYPQDSSEQMVELAKEAGFTFPYLFDEDQTVALAYHAACTPDFFLFDRDRRLVYRGQLDDSRPGNGIPVTGSDLTAAIDAVLQGKNVTIKQKPSIGCNIKWKQENEPEYFKNV